jgi:hypothetical protein
MTAFRPDIPPHVAEIIRHLPPDVKRGIRQALRALSVTRRLANPYGENWKGSGSTAYGGFALSMRLSILTGPSALSLLDIGAGFMKRRRSTSGIHSRPSNYGALFLALLRVSFSWQASAARGFRHGDRPTSLCMNTADADLPPLIHRRGLLVATTHDAPVAVGLTADHHDVDILTTKHRD